MYKKIPLEPTYTDVSEKLQILYFCQFINTTFGMEVEGFMYKHVHYNIINVNKNAKLFDYPFIFNRLSTFYWTYDLPYSY